MNSQFISWIPYTISRCIKLQRSKANYTHIWSIFSTSALLLKIDSSAFIRSYHGSAKPFQIVGIHRLNKMYLCLYIVAKYFYTCQNISDLFYSIHFNTISRFGYFSYIRSPQYISNTPSNYPASATVGKLKSIISTPSKNISATATLKSYSEPLISNNNNNNNNSWTLF